MLGLSLPITTLRGLALLGLRAPNSLTISRADGRTEVIRLWRVVCRANSVSWHVPIRPLRETPQAGPRVVELRSYRGKSTSDDQDDDPSTSLAAPLRDTVASSLSGDPTIRHLATAGLPSRQEYQESQFRR